MVSVSFNFHLPTWLMHLVQKVYALFRLPWSVCFFPLGSVRILGVISHLSEKSVCLFSTRHPTKLTCVIQIPWPSLVNKRKSQVGFSPELQLFSYIWIIKDIIEIETSVCFCENPRTQQPFHQRNPYVYLQPDIPQHTHLWFKFCVLHLSTCCFSLKFASFQLCLNHHIC